MNNHLSPVSYSDSVPRQPNFPASEEGQDQEQHLLDNTGHTNFLFQYLEESKARVSGYEAQAETSQTISGLDRSNDPLFASETQLKFDEAGHGSKV